MMNLVSFSGS